MIRVIGIGDNVVDKYLYKNTMYPGGNALNFAIYAKWIGAESGYIGVFGDDKAGKHVYHTAQKVGVDLHHSRMKEGENGYAEVTLKEGDRVFIGSNGGGVSKDFPLKLTQVDLEYISTYDLVHSSCFSFMEKELVKLKVKGIDVSFDFSDRFTEQYLEQICPNIMCACLSCGHLSDEEIVRIIDIIRGYGTKIIIATRGSRGALVSREGILYEQSPYLVEATDTMGAGDSFITAFLVSYMEGLDSIVDFNNDGNELKGVVDGETYKDYLTKISLYRAAVFSAKTCLTDGSFGYGVEI